MQFTHTAKPVPVHAAVILDVTKIPFPEGTNGTSPNLMLRLSDGRNFEASTSMTARYVPVAGDYLVTQEDGYEYLNPKDVFERKYSAIAPLKQEPSNITAAEWDSACNGLGGQYANRY